MITRYYKIKVRKCEPEEEPRELCVIGKHCSFFANPSRAYDLADEQLNKEGFGSVIIIDFDRIK